MPEALVFKPRKEFALDALLVVNIFLLLVYTSQYVSPVILILAGIVSNAVVLLFWWYVVQNVFKVKIQDNTISGPADGFLRTSFLLRKVDHAKLDDRSSWEKFFGIHTVFSFDGTKIRLYSRLIGRGPTNKILSIIEKFPFRETAE
jgi:hypothetical protein